MRWIDHTRRDILLRMLGMAFSGLLAVVCQLWFGDGLDTAAEHFEQKVERMRSSATGLRQAADESQQLDESRRIYERHRNSTHPTDTLQRLWLQELAGIGSRLGLADLEYKLRTQLMSRGREKSESDAVASDITVTRLRVRSGLRHEEELGLLLEQLVGAANGLAEVHTCELRRAPRLPGDAASRPAPALRFDCELRAYRIDATGSRS